jgi:putative oxidoreductase
MTQLKTVQEVIEMKTDQRTRDFNATLLTLRVVLGSVMFAHGAQKLLGWFGGYGFEGTMGFLTGTMHLPTPIAWLVIGAEFFGAIGLVTGTLTRLSAFGVLAVMVGAVVTTHLPNGLFMNWTGAQKGEGFEYHLLVIAMAAPMILFGAGAYSIDALISRLRKAGSLKSINHEAALSA